MKQLRMSNAITWISFGLALIIYAFMILNTLPSIATYADGAVAFDMRPGGYSFDEAQSFLVKLGENGRHYYLTRQLVLDIFYPVFLAMALFGFLKMLANSAKGAWKNALIIGAYSSFVCAAFDYAENILIANMLLSEEIHVSLVGTASWMTVGKSLGTTIVFCVLLIGIVVKISQNLKRRFSLRP